MTSKVFKITEYASPGQHIRQFHRATIDGKDQEVEIKIKQYTPLDNQTPREGDVTIIGGHANGFPKELYEPLWVELHRRLKASGVRIRGIWIADVSHQGLSSVANENKLGNDPSWFDHPRDLLLMINHFRSQIQRPIYGIGHSMGGAQLTYLSLFHPRLFAGLALLDPVIQRAPSKEGNFAPARASAFRRDIWPSRAAAAESFKRSKFYQAWDPRVLDLWVQYGLRDLPTALHSLSDASKPTSDVATKLAPVTAEPTVTPPPAPPVTLTTTPAQEVWTFLRANYSTEGPGPHGLTASTWLTHQNRATHPDISPLPYAQAPLYRGEPLLIFEQLPHLRPPVLYIFGDTSYLSAPEHQADKLRITGVGASGSGGVPAGRVRSVTFRDTGHLIPMERVKESADEITVWLVGELERWRKEEEVALEGYAGLGEREKRVLDERFKEALGGPPVRREKKL